MRGNPHMTYKELLCSFKQYARELLYIQTETGALKKFELNEVQEVLEEIVERIQSEGRLVRLVILKARREGVSTWTSARFFWEAVRCSGTNCYLVTQIIDATDTIFSMQKRMWENLVDVLDGRTLYKRPETVYNNAKVLEFRDLDSRIKVATASSASASRGSLIHHLHLSEVAHWPGGKGQELLTAVLNCVPDIPGTSVILESTANGIGGIFYNRWNECRSVYEMYMEGGQVRYREVVRAGVSEENQYVGVFIPWYVFKSYRRPTPVGFKQTAEELQLQLSYGLDDEQLSWRRSVMENKCADDALRGMTKEQMFRQEFPANASEAFLSTGMNVFEVELLQRIEKTLTPPVMRYELIGSNFIPTKAGSLEVWVEPGVGEEYIISCDVSEGLHRGDWTSIDVIKWLTGEQVAHVHMKMAPDKVGDYLFYLGHRYNQALVAIERNNHGLTTLTHMMRDGYPSRRVYAQVVDVPPNRKENKYGFLTTRQNKNVLIDGLVKILREGTHGIVCKDLIEELKFYQINSDNGSMGAVEGKHDDRVMSYGIAQYVKEGNPLPGMWDRKQSKNIGVLQRQEIQQGGKLDGYV